MFSFEVRKRSDETISSLHLTSYIGEEKAQGVLVFSRPDIAIKYTGDKYMVLSVGWSFWSD